MPNIPEAGLKKRLVIIGGGFGGLELTRKIYDRLFQVVLLDRHTYYQFQPLMYQVATGGLEPASIVYPLRKSFHRKKDFHFRMCSVDRIDPELGIVHTSIGAIRYDQLVIATGAKTNYFGNNDIENLTHGLKSIPEALLLRNKILLALERAVNSMDEDEQRDCLTFVVVGGGATGVELAGALADMKNTVLPKDYPDINLSAMTIHLVDGSDRILASMSEHASAKATKILEKRGVVIHQKVMVESCDDHEVRLGNGLRLPSGNVFWVAGVRPASIPGLPDESYEKGSIVIDQYCRVKGCNAIHAIGDTAKLTNNKYPKGHPQVAQVAMQMAGTVAHNLNLAASGSSRAAKAFRYSDKGTMATIGRNAAVADIGKLRFSGWLAWVLWLFIHLVFIIGIKNKLFVIINWTWNYFRYDSSLRLLIKPEASSIYCDERPAANAKLPSKEPGSQ